MDEPILEARDVGRRADSVGHWLLRSICVAIRPGERVAIVGPSGSGKTLLLRALAYLDPIDSGEVIWRKRPLRGQDIPEFRRFVTYVHQRPALFEGSVEHNLRRPYELKSHRGAQFDWGRILDWLTSLGRDATFLEKSQQNLSGGELQIVALLRALQLDPSVLLLDEPTASLDAPTAIAVEQMTGQWMAADSLNRAIIWVSHDQEQARRVSDRAIRIDSGRLEPD